MQHTTKKEPNGGWLFMGMVSQLPSLDQAGFSQIAVEQLE
jgi:hypothetical protein